MGKNYDYGEDEFDEFYDNCEEDESINNEVLAKSKVSNQSTDIDKVEDDYAIFHWSY